MQRHRFDGNADILISAALHVEVLYALVLELKDISGLGAGVHFIAYLSVKGGHLYLMAKSSL